MKKFNTYNGFYVKSDKKSHQPSTITPKTLNEIDSSFLDPNLDYNNATADTTYNNIRTNTFESSNLDKKPPYNEVISEPYIADDYAYSNDNLADYQAVAISMKTRKLLQLSKSHDMAIKRILSENSK